MIFEEMNLPEKAKIDAIIHKKVFYENTSLTKQEQELIKSDVDKVIWEFSLKEGTINIEKYISEDMEYIEVNFITCILREKKNHKKISELIQKSIPYPIVLILESKDSLFISCAEKRINKNDPTKMVITEEIISEEININKLESTFYDYIERIKLKNLSYKNFYELYNGIFDNTVKLNLSRHTGKIAEINGNNDSLTLLNEIEEIKGKIEVLKGKIKKETQINKMVEMNIELEKYKQQLAQLI